MKQKTADLQGQALDWAVAKAESRVIIQFLGGGILVNGRTELGVELDIEQGFNYMWHPSSSWSQAGPIIEREKIRLDCAWHPIWTAQSPNTAKIDGYTGWIEGATPLIAAMRCYCASKLGTELEVPDGLV
jgi:hypothetical protein